MAEAREMIPDERIYMESYHEGRPEPLMVLFRIISRHSWEELQAWHRANPGSRVEHLEAGLYVLFLEPGGALEAA